RRTPHGTGQADASRVASAAKVGHRACHFGITLLPRRVTMAPGMKAPRAWRYAQGWLPVFATSMCNP
ncbi:hypothetical protein HAX54_035554, partial [Datura stramonium]|nr:hypothetical protein [Datura stramonium]